MPTNCAQGTLAPYVPSAANPWNRQRAQHLLRRLGYSAPPAAIDALVVLPPGKAVDTLVDAAAQLPPFPAPPWANWNLNNYQDIGKEAQAQYAEWITTTIKGMLSNGFREKLTLFWHNHFVTQTDVYFCPSYLYQYHNLLQTHALGNFKNFVKAIGLTPAMLVYLNGVQNNRFRPNENYARELFELFTLGRDQGYTQTDIRETARALTGWNGATTPCGSISFVKELFDPGNKTIFGKTGAYGYNELHDLLFAERRNQIATFICRKLYSHFVNPEPDEAIVAGLAQTFLANNFELAPVLRQLFKSEHFFDTYIIGVQIKSPYDFVLTLIQELNLQIPSEDVYLAIFYFCGQLGQELFQPLDVAGWPGNRTWVTNTYLSGRWQAMDFLLYSIYEQQPQLFRTLAKYLSNNSRNPETVTRAIAQFFLPQPQEELVDLKLATAVFKSEVPQNYFDDEEWNLDWDVAPAQVALLLRYLGRLPEFQLT